MPGCVDNSGNLSGTGVPFTEGETDPGNYATYRPDVYDPWPEGIGPPYYRTVVGEWENSGSPYGTFDQGGNVGEWTEAVRLGTYRVVRGGSFLWIDYGCSLHASWRDHGYPTNESSGAGFRLAWVPEPATLLILALGSVGVLRRQR
jgi:formylglycine-generating enzyme required for sulfatase activity